MPDQYKDGPHVNKQNVRLFMTTEPWVMHFINVRQRSYSPIVHITNDKKEQNQVWIFSAEIPTFVDIQRHLGIYDFLSLY